MEKPTNLKFSVKTFLSDEIDSLLERSPNFRHLQHNDRNVLVREMRSGRWRSDNGEVLIFDEEGLVVDGQHRLAAAAIYQRETGDHVWFAVVSGAARVAERTLDTGRNRKFSHFMRTEKVKRGTIVAAIVASHLRVETAGRKAALSAVAGAVTSYDAGAAAAGVNKSTNLRASPGEMIDYFKRNRKALEKWAEVADKLRTAGFIRCSTLASVGYQLARVDSADADLFFEKLRSGSDMKPGDPVLALRNRLAAAAATKAMAPKPLWVAAITVLAWGLWRRGETVEPGKLRWIASGPRAQDFPPHHVDRFEG